MKIRGLKKDEIEVRPIGIKQDSCTLILYKDARCVQRVLDETFGKMNWQCSHEEKADSLFCVIAVWDNVKQQWIRKEDNGKESYFEKEKGQSSDSFKRAGTNWGIGRELYTAPYLHIRLNTTEVEQYEADKYRCKVSFYVKEIRYRKGNISKLIICDDFGDIRYSYPNSADDEAKKACMKKLNECRDMEQLRSVWIMYRQLHNDREVISLKDEMKKALTQSTNEKLKEKFDSVLNH